MLCFSKLCYFFPQKTGKGKQIAKIDPPQSCFGSLVYFVRSSVLRVRERWPSCNRLGILCSWQGKMGEWGRGIKSDLFNFSLPCLTELLCLLPGNCNTPRYKCIDCIEKDSYQPPSLSFLFSLLHSLVSSTPPSLLSCCYRWIKGKRKAIK